MAEYENPEIPEGINVSPTHPLKDFALLVSGISALIIVAVLALSLLAGQLARHIPFAQERALAASLGRWLPEPPDSAVAKQRQHYLQTLTNRLAGTMALPPEMPITVHYSSSQTVNAMATLGGHIVVFQGLIDTLPSENALAMVLAHEIAHVRHRDPVVAMGRGFAVMLALSSLAGFGDGALQQWLGGVGMLPILSFSRSQEEAADSSALQAVLDLYGHVGDAAAFFEKVAERQSAAYVPTMFNTHPDVDQRIARIREFAARHAKPEQAPATPLRAFLKAA
ncbi:MAG: M48 family metallopeptidase [Gammaproteobacteria bacterium]|nr:M48 family metallopeptidase [Gammaproteobacteria bacterium]MBU1601876.1 M48 family metallopeptidase [Gammaproteobacteria bacterium]MBU2432248.1 M48 family metallopeptidase [Gammaproteobacteria bacterium]MBU2450359.1 M48 family metallopeptidase [Gammaproteobacteria bacterium]